MGKVTAANRKSGTVPHASTTMAASHTPADCPENRKNANSETPAPRASGAICVALTCKVLCSMYSPAPADNRQGTA